MMKRLLFLIALVGLTAITAPVRAADPVEIDVILAMTGVAGFLGQQEAQSLRALERVVNSSGGIQGRDVHFAIVDDASNPATAVQLAAAIVARNPPVMLGPTLTGSCAAVASLVRAGPVQYCLSPSVHPSAGSFTFSSFISTRDLSLAALRYFRERGWKRIALITSTDATGQDGESVVMQNLQLPENKGMALVANEHFATGDVSVAAQMTRIKAQNPQALVTWTTGTPFGTVLHGVSDAGLDIPVMSNPANLVRAQEQQYRSFMPTQVYFVGGRILSSRVVRIGPLRDAQDAFFRALAKDGIVPETAHTFSWDPATIVVDALRHVGSTASAAQIRDYIEALHGFAATNGLYDFRDGGQRGLTLSSAVVSRWNAQTSNFDAVSSGGGSPLP